MNSFHHRAYASVLKILETGYPPFLPGPTGCGKTTLAFQIAQTLSLPFYYTGPVDSAYQLRGFKDAQGRVVETQFRKAYETGGLFFFDELDACDPQALIAVHTALDNGVLDAPDGMVERHKDFHYIAAANTYGHGATRDYIGRNPLDGATKDRYIFYPLDYDRKLEEALIGEANPAQKDWLSLVHRARQAARELGIRQIISMRACLHGAALLDQGFSRATTFRMTVAKSLSKDDAIKLWHAAKKITDKELAFNSDEEKQNRPEKSPNGMEEREDLEDLSKQVGTALSHLIELKSGKSLRSRLVKSLLGLS